MRSFVAFAVKIIPKIFKDTLKNKKIVLLIVAVIAVILIFNLFRNKNPETQIFKRLDDQRIQAPEAKARQDINQSFIFSIGNSKILYTIENAELQDQIIIKGQIAKSVKSKTFLVLNLKIRNDSKEVIEVNTRDYVRLTTNDNKNDKIALEIHNDPVLVQPISTKSTRLGIPIKDTDKNLSLYVGEIAGKKKIISINFK